MIESLHIEDLGVIEEADLPLSRGLTALTGETGAGKTMVLTSLGLLLGQRAETTIVRTGAERSLDVPVGARIRVSRAKRPVRLARFNEAPFASRLVRKFDLPVEGWRASSSADEAYSAEDEALHQPMARTSDGRTGAETLRDSSGRTS